MAYREVAMWEILAVLERFGRGETGSPRHRSYEEDDSAVCPYCRGSGLEAGNGSAHRSPGGRDVPSPPDDGKPRAGRG
jgi:hypothetical protein